MQIDRSPSRGPYVAALICLFVLCLIVPVYWQTGERLTERARPLGVERATDDSFRSDFYSATIYGWRAGHPGFAPEQPLDELLSEFAARQSQNFDDDLFTQYLTIPAEREAALADLAHLPSYVTDVFHHAGRHVGRRPSVDISPLVARFLETTTTAPQRRTARLMLLPANSRRFDVDAFESPWCSPTMLMQSLERLAQHPHSSDWAWETMDQFRALTAARQVRSSEVAAHLLRLEALHREAYALAETTHDDCLRAELLRAHWGLTRRLACWAPMRDIVVASAAANRFAARSPWDAMSPTFAGQGTTTVDMHDLCRDLEQYERARNPQLARAIVERQRQLMASTDVRQRELGDQIEQNYRNANVRFALSSAMLERFVPQTSAEVSPVRDRIAGTPIRGRSQTFSENHVRLHPDEYRWNLELESQGMIESNTYTSGGPVKVRSQSSTQFTAEKSIVVEHGGVRMGQTSADVQTHNRLMGIETNFDWMPVMNDLIRGRAMEEYCAKRARAAAEVEYKIARRVESQLDHRAINAVEKLEDDLRVRVTGPLASAGVAWEPIQLSTTADRIVARLRVAGSDQLAGHTPRPRAPSDSVASLQLHESALTNAAGGLELEGRRLTAPELQTLLRQKFARSSQPESLGIDSDTVFEFADKDAVRTRIADDRLEVILSLSEVKHERNTVRDFRVHAFYRPIIHGVEAELVRDGSLGVEGRLGSGDRARMHGVFNKVLSEERRLPIVRLANPQDPRVAGLMITQLVLEDGWMGLAVGPTQNGRTAERSRMLR